MNTVFYDWANVQWLEHALRLAPLNSRKLIEYRSTDPLGPVDISENNRVGLLVADIDMNLRPLKKRLQKAPTPKYGVLCPGVWQHAEASQVQIGNYIGIGWSEMHLDYSSTDLRYLSRLHAYFAPSFAHWECLW